MLTKNKILIIDDSKTQNFFLTKLLLKHGYEVSSAIDANDALFKLSISKPDLIVMDIVMPGMNGFQFTRVLSNEADYKDIPIILCSSKNTAIDKVWGMRQGAKAYITKPIDEDELIATLRGILK